MRGDAVGGYGEYEPIADSREIICEEPGAQEVVGEEHRRREEANRGYAYEQRDTSRGEIPDEAYAVLTEARHWLLLMALAFTVI